MRRVLVNGQTYDLPDHEEYHVMWHEGGPHEPKQARYTFFPLGSDNAHRVRVETTKPFTGWMAENVAAPNVPPVDVTWEPIENYLTADHADNFNCFVNGQWNELNEVTITASSPVYHNQYYPEAKMGTTTGMQNINWEPRVQFNTEYEYKVDWGQELKLNNPCNEEVLPFSGGEAVNSQDSLLEPYYQKKEERMSRLFTGLRVAVQGLSNRSRTVRGTVIDAPYLPPGTVLVCLDRKSTKYAHGSDYCGAHYGALVRQEQVMPLEDQTSAKTFQGVPSHIGVCVREPFIHDNGKFLEHAIGRVISTDTRNNLALVAWLNVRNPDFFARKDAEGNVYESCYNVPADKLQWCMFDTCEKTILSRWPIGNDGPKYEPGDYVLYDHRESFRVASPNDGQTYNIHRGAIMKVMQFDGRNVHFELVGGVDPNCIGIQYRTGRNRVKPLDFPFVEQGTSVEIVAEIDFRKTPLKGKKGTVVLPTDPEGDVGVQFPEEIEGAGSLDGAGASGKCLYVPATAVEVSE